MSKHKSKSKRSRKSVIQSFANSLAYSKKYMNFITGPCLLCFFIFFAYCTLVYDPEASSINLANGDALPYFDYISNSLADVSFQFLGLFGTCGIVMFGVKSSFDILNKRCYLLWRMSLIVFMTCLICLVSSFVSSNTHYCGVVGKFLLHGLEILAQSKNLSYIFVQAFVSVSCLLLCISVLYIANVRINTMFGYLTDSWAFISKIIKKLYEKFNHKDFDNELSSCEFSDFDNKNQNKDASDFKEKRKSVFDDVKQKKNSVQPKFQNKFILPSTNFLKKEEIVKNNITKDNLERSAENLISVLGDFGIDGEITAVSPGPVVTLYELKPAAGIKSARVIGLASDIARYMSAISARVSVVPGKNALGIELPNKNRNVVYLRSILESDAYKNSNYALPIILGRNIGGKPVVVDLAKTPHLLIAGTTGSGKSVGINAMILSLLYKLPPNKCKFIMVDPKMLELSVYDEIPHLLTPVVTDPKKAVFALKWAVKEMENRYIAMSRLGVRNIEGYNAKISEILKDGGTPTRRVQTGFDPETGLPIYEEQALSSEELPYIVVVVDEMADLMLVAGKEIETLVQRLAQMARAAGIHLIMATQRPSVDVITGTIKANFPTRVSFQVSSKIDSRTILGEQGAEQLLGQGDMLYLATGGRLLRVHGPFVSDQEVETIVCHLKTQGEPMYIEEILACDDSVLGGSNQDSDDGTDPMYKEAVDLIMREGKVSTSFLQRHLQIGYNRAARIVDIMEKNGIVSPANHVGKREILR